MTDSDSKFEKGQRALGRSCASMNLTNPCLVKAAVPKADKYRIEDSLLYMVDTTSKFIDTLGENTEGMFDYPATGDVVHTNSGQSSVMLVSHRKV